MSEDTIVKGIKRKPPNDDLTVYVDGKILNRFMNFSISHSIDTVPMTFSLEYGMQDAENENLLDFIHKATTSNTNAKGLLKVGQKIEIYLQKQKVMTAWIDNVTEAYSYGQHTLYIDGRSIVSVLVDSTTDKPSGMLPDTVVSLADAANYMFEGFGIKVIDKTNGSTKRNITQYTQIDLTTKPYDYVANLALYEGKLLYDNELGCMVIDEVAKAQKMNGETDNGYDKDGVEKRNGVIKDENSGFQQVMNHQTTLGRYREYRFVSNPVGGIAGIDQSLQMDVKIQDKDANQLPPGKKITIVQTAAYSTDSGDGYTEFTQTLGQYIANKNWGNGQTISALASGYINPITNKLWRVNDIVNFDYKKPLIKGWYVVQSVNFYLDTNSGKTTELIFVRRESLLPEPITLNALIAGVTNSVNNTEDSTNNGELKDSADPKTQKLNVPDNPPDNAKPVNKEN